jgi:ketosteroid isomerase-like protein
MDDVEARLDRLESYEAIRQLVYRYAIAVDARDIDTIVDCFVDDVRLGDGVSGSDALRAQFETSLAMYPLMILNVGNHHIEFRDADHARGVVYCRGEIETGPEEWLVQMIMYRDRYERRAGTWQFRTREHLLFYGADLLQRPIGLPPAGKPEEFFGRGSAPQVWPTYEAFWTRHGAPSAYHG